MLAPARYSGVFPDVDQSDFLFPEGKSAAKNEQRRIFPYRKSVKIARQCALVINFHSLIFLPDSGKSTLVSFLQSTASSRVECSP